MADQRSTFQEHHDAHRRHADELARYGERRPPDVRPDGVRDDHEDGRTGSIGRFVRSPLGRIAKGGLQQLPRVPRPLDGRTAERALESAPDPWLRQKVGKRRLVRRQAVGEVVRIERSVEQRIGVGAVACAGRQVVVKGVDAGVLQRGICGTVEGSIEQGVRVAAIDRASAEVMSQWIDATGDDLRVGLSIEPAVEEAAGGEALVAAPAVMTEPRVHPAAQLSSESKRPLRGPADHEGRRGTKRRGQLPRFGAVQGVELQPEPTQLDRVASQLGQVPLAVPNVGFEAG